MSISQEKAQQLYEEIADRLHSIWMLGAEQDSEGKDAFDESEIVLELVADLDERGVDPEAAMRVLKSVAMLRRKARDE